MDIEIKENILLTKNDYIIEEMLKKFEVNFTKIKKKYFPEIGAFHND